MATPRSLILITVDCLRADHVGFLGYQRPTTPFLDSLASDSLVFHNAIVAGAPTYYSFPAIMASRHPLALGRDVIGLAPGEPTLATTLSESGYATGAFVAANPYLSSRFGYNEGFDIFRDGLDLEIAPSAVDGENEIKTGLQSGLNRSLADLSHRLGPVGAIYDELYFRYCQRLASAARPSFETLRRFPSADVIVNQARQWLSGLAGKPFFLWLHFMDPHSPYYPPPEALKLFGQGNPDPARACYLNSYWNRGELSVNRFQRYRDEVVTLYDAGIRWVDQQVAQLVDALRGFGMWDNCALALTADHGEEFLDHGGRYHSPPGVNEEIIHVPLLVHAPGLGNPEPIRQPFSLIDLAPTLLDLVDAQVPGSFHGRGRWAQLRSKRTWDEPAVIECVPHCRNPFRLKERLGPRILAVREARFKLVFDLESSRERLFDLQDESQGSRPLAPDAHMPERRHLLERARRHLVESLRSRDADSRLAARLRTFRLEWANSTPTTST